MTRYVLRPRAQRDIEDIWDYSAQNWGERHDSV
jgi:plasmid stabilization system protein ParE